ncbi:hypothetical protein SLE2022_044910 [Rubroshorea leprosula]
MKQKLFFSITFTFLASLASSQICLRSCGRIPLRYPFGIGEGCGDPQFQQFICCNGDELTFKTHTGSYPITNIDYTKQEIYITDPSMSTCACNQPSKGFGLDRNAPFDFTEDTIFTLLECSIDSSPIFRGGKNTSFPMCDQQGSPICSYLYSCNAISLLNLPISTCCVYTPVDLGPSFEMDLQTLQCSSYSAFYSFNGQQSNPENWKYGIALKYKINVYNYYPGFCKDCEKSDGICSYAAASNSFFCNCPTGINTSSSCYYVQSYSNAFRVLPWLTGIFLVHILAWILRWVSL